MKKSRIALLTTLFAVAAIAAAAGYARLSQPAAGDTSAAVQTTQASKTPTKQHLCATCNYFLTLADEDETDIDDWKKPVKILVGWVVIYVSLGLLPSAALIARAIQHSGCPKEAKWYLGTVILSIIVKTAAMSFMITQLIHYRKKLKQGALPAKPQKGKSARSLKKSTMKNLFVVCSRLFGISLLAIWVVVIHCFSKCNQEERYTRTRMP